MGKVEEPTWAAKILEPYFRVMAATTGTGGRDGFEKSVVDILYTTDFSKPITGRTACCCSHRSENMVPGCLPPTFGLLCSF